jgi:hypothetical protein
MTTQQELQDIRFTGHCTACGGGVFLPPNKEAVDQIQALLERERKEAAIDELERVRPRTLPISKRIRELRGEA